MRSFLMSVLEIKDLLGIEPIGKARYEEIQKTRCCDNYGYSIHIR